MRVTEDVDGTKILNPFKNGFVFRDIASGEKEKGCDVLLGKNKGNTRKGRKGKKRGGQGVGKATLSTEMRL